MSHGIGDRVSDIVSLAWIGELFRAQTDLLNERIEGKMPACFRRGSSGIQHERDSKEVFAPCVPGEPQRC